jgi:hypothetical protein
MTSKRRLIMPTGLMIQTELIIPTVFIPPTKLITKIKPEALKNQKQRATNSLSQSIIQKYPLPTQKTISAQDIEHSYTQAMRKTRFP